MKGLTGRWEEGEREIRQHPSNWAVARCRSCHRHSLLTELVLESRSGVKMHLGKFEGEFWMASEERREKVVSD